MDTVQTYKYCVYPEHKGERYLPLDAFYSFRRNTRGGKRYYRPYCKLCDKIRNTKVYDKRVTVGIERRQSRREAKGKVTVNRPYLCSYCFEQCSEKDMQFRMIHGKWKPWICKVCNRANSKYYYRRKNAKSRNSKHRIKEDARGILADNKTNSKRGISQLLDTA